MKIAKFCARPVKCYKACEIIEATLTPNAMVTKAEEASRLIVASTVGMARSQRLQRHRESLLAHESSWPSSDSCELIDGRLYYWHGGMD